MTQEEQYTFDMTTAIADAIIAVGKKHGSEKYSLLLTGEITIAMIDSLAMIIHNSDAVSSPTKRQDFARKIAIMISNKITYAQRYAKEHGDAFSGVLNKSDLN